METCVSDKQTDTERASVRPAPITSRFLSSDKLRAARLTIRCKFFVSSDYRAMRQIVANRCFAPKGRTRFRDRAILLARLRNRDAIEWRFSVMAVITATIIISSNGAINFNDCTYVTIDKYARSRASLWILLVRLNVGRTNTHRVCPRRDIPFCLTKF